MTHGKRCKPLSYAEDQLIRRLGPEGFSPREMVGEFAKAGFRRSRHTLHDYMKEVGVETDPVAYFNRTGQPLRDGGAYKIEDRNHHYIDPFEANDTFRVAFMRGSGGRVYTDDPRASPGKDAGIMRRCFAADRQTTGGVAVYG